MRSVKLFEVLAVLLVAQPAFTDTWTVFPLPTSGVYLVSTTNFGGGDGSGGSISTVGPQRA
jgi:hypothetical protein